MDLKGTRIEGANKNAKLKNRMMQKIFVLFLSLFSCLCLKAQSLSGHVMDATTHQAVTGATVYFPQLKLGAVSDVKGNYKIAPLPKGTYEVELEMVGYATLTKQITIHEDVMLDFALSVSSASLKEVIITALGNATTLRRAPTPVSVVTHDMFLQQSSTNVVDAIARQPGITAITTGPGVSKPEINGLGYNRVLVLMDGEGRKISSGETNMAS